MRHKQATINDAILALDILGGINGVRAVGKGREFEPVKYGKEFLGRYEALRNNLGDDLTAKLLANKIRIVPKDQTWVIESVPEPLFYKNGRLIPRRDLQGEVYKPPTHSGNYKFGMREPNNDHGQILARLQDAFRSKDGWPSAGEFKFRIAAIEERLKADEPVSRILEGFGFDFCIPLTQKGDLGKIISTRFVSALSRAFNKEFKPRRYFNEEVSYSHDRYGYNKGYSSKKLEGQLTVVEGSRHEELMEKVSHEYVIGKFFPCMQGYPVEAAREAIKTLPDGFFLNGGYDTFCTLIGHVDNFGEDEPWNTRPSIPFTALQFSPFTESSIAFDTDVIGAKIAETHYVSNGYTEWAALVVVG